MVARDEVVEREGLWRGGERKGEWAAGGEEEVDGEGEGFLVVDLGLGVVEEEEEEDKRCIFFGARCDYVNNIWYFGLAFRVRRNKMKKGGGAGEEERRRHNKY